jgi:hypothetical protein
MLNVSTVPAHSEGDHASSRLARRVWMSDVEDSSRRFSCDIDSRKSPVARAVGIDKAAIRRIFIAIVIGGTPDGVIRNS